MRWRYLGTSHGGRYKYHCLPDGYVYQSNLFGRCVGWICTFTVWESTMRTILDKDFP